MTSRTVRVLLLSGALAAVGCGSPGDLTHESATGPSDTPVPVTVGPGSQYMTIQSAVNAVPAGSTITVQQGTYGERLVIAKSLKLVGNQAILDGLAGGLDGRFLGVEVRADDVEISGFIVQNFERAIVVDHAFRFRLRSSEIRNNTSKDPPPIVAGVTKSDGVVLVTCQDSEISGNYFHDNGSIGLWLSQGSGANTVRSNRFVNNGTQQGLAGQSFGTGILTSGQNNTQNTITDNEVSSSDWGIQIGGSPDSANMVESNRVHANRRAGIGVWGQNNRVAGNDATGNGLSNIPPSCGLDLMDWNGLDNDWLGNSGTLGSPSAPGPRTCN